MSYIGPLLGFIAGLSVAACFLRYRIKELYNLRRYYLLGQEEETKFVKDKVLKVEFDLNALTYQIRDIHNKLDVLNKPDSTF
jgi:hypothetical protein